MKSVRVEGRKTGSKEKVREKEKSKGRRGWVK